LPLLGIESNEDDLNQQVRGSMKKQVLALVLLFLSTQAHAAWTAYVDFRSCPRQHVSATTGSEGPFNSEAECLARVDEANRAQKYPCARFSCVNQTGAASDSSPVAAGHELDKNIGDALAAGLQGQISAGDTVGLVGMGLMGNALLAPSAPARQKSFAELEAERIAGEKAAIAQEKFERESREKKDRQVAPMFALLDPIPASPDKDANQPRSDSYSKGFEHASQCISQNSGTACSGSTAEQQENCIAEYRAGYELGTMRKEATLQEANQAGQGAASRGEKNSSFTDQRAQGPCRLEWMDSYKQGYLKNKNEKKGL
jgi:hypothetical protein